MFTLPVNDLLTALANVSMFAAKKDKDREHLTGVRLRVTGPNLEVLASDSYVAAQGRAAGENIGGNFTVLVHPTALKPVIDALKANLFTTARLDLTEYGLQFFIGPDELLLTVRTMDGLHRYPAAEHLFNIPVGDSAGYIHIDPKRLALLAKLKEYGVKPDAQPGVTVTAGKKPDKALLASFGHNLRFVLMPIRTNVLPDTHADAQTGLDWMAGAVASKAAA